MKPSYWAQSETHQCKINKRRSYVLPILTKTGVSWLQGQIFLLWNVGVLPVTAKPIQRCFPSQENSSKSSTVTVGKRNRKAQSRLTPAAGMTRKKWKKEANNREVNAWQVDGASSSWWIRTYLQKGMGEKGKRGWSINYRSNFKLQETNVFDLKSKLGADSTGEELCLPFYLWEPEEPQVSLCSETKVRSSRKVTQQETNITAGQTVCMFYWVLRKCSFSSVRLRYDFYRKTSQLLHLKMFRCECLTSKLEVDTNSQFLVRQLAVWYFNWKIQPRVDEQSTESSSFIHSL